MNPAKLPLAVASATDFPGPCNHCRTGSGPRRGPPPLRWQHPIRGSVAVLALALPATALPATAPVAMAPAAPTQTTAIKLLGENAGDGLGWALAMLDDVDGDGVRDVASGETRYQSVVATGGRVQVLSLRTGELLAQWTGDFQQFLGAFVARVGDHDGDGLADLLIAGDPGLSTALDARIVSPSSGATLLVLPPPPGGDLTYGAAAGVGDLTGDGVSELVVGWPFAYGTGAVGLIDGASAAILHEFRGAGSNDRFGWSVVELGDVDGDGLGDFAASTFTLPIPGHPPTPAAPGYVRVYSGAGPVALATLFAPDLAASFGRGLARLGDVDGDLITELLVIEDHALHTFRIGTPHPSGPARSRPVPSRDRCRGSLGRWPAASTSMAMAGRTPR